MNPTSPSEKRTLTLLFVSAITLIVTGVALLCYPIVGNLLANRERSQATAVYDQSMKQMAKQEKQDRLAEAKRYNDWLFERQEGQLGVPVPYQSTITGAEHSDYVMGTLDIPAIDIKGMPFYHGTTYETLDKGLGHFEPTSLPVGGKNTRSVISGHSGVKNQILFTDVINLKEGDMIFVNILGEKLAYKIESFEEVLPKETDKVKIIPNEDMLTLLTCTPPGINTYRLLVNAKRVPYESAKTAPVHKRNTWSYQNIVIISLALVAMISLVLYIIYRYLKHALSKALNEMHILKYTRRLQVFKRVAIGFLILLCVIMLAVLVFAIYAYLKSAQVI